jgi:hypothetical protein
MRRSIPTANEQVYCSKMLVFTENNQALLSQRMKRVCDGDFARQNSGTMNYLPMTVANVRRPFTACLALPSSTILIPNSIYAMSWSASPIIRSTVSTNSCPGTWPPSFQRISRHPRLNHAAYQDGLETTLLSIRWGTSCSRFCHIARGRNQELLRFSPGFTHSAGSRPAAAVGQGVTGRSGMLAGVCVV